MNTHQTAESPYERVLRLGREQGIEQGIERGIERGIEQGIERGIEQGIEQGRLNALIELAVDFGASEPQLEAWTDLPIDEAIPLVRKWIRESRSS